MTTDTCILYSNHNSTKYSSQIKTIFKDLIFSYIDTDNNTQIITIEEVAKYYSSLRELDQSSSIKLNMLPTSFYLERIGRRIKKEYVYAAMCIDMIRTKSTVRQLFSYKSYTLYDWSVLNSKTDVTTEPSLGVVLYPGSIFTLVDSGNPIVGDRDRGVGLVENKKKYFLHSTVSFDPVQISIPFLYVSDPRYSTEGTLNALSERIAIKNIAGCTDVTVKKFNGDNAFLLHPAILDTIFQIVDITLEDPYECIQTEYLTDRNSNTKHLFIGST